MLHGDDNTAKRVGPPAATADALAVGRKGKAGGRPQGRRPEEAFAGEAACAAPNAIAGSLSLRHADPPQS